jgi:hypothetical protein
VESLFVCHGIITTPSETYRQSPLSGRSGDYTEIGTIANPRQYCSGVAELFAPVFGSGSTSKSGLRPTAHNRMQRGPVAPLMKARLNWNFSRAG